MTGGTATHDAIVWGPPSEQAERKARDDPLLKVGRGCCNMLRCSLAALLSSFRASANIYGGPPVAMGYLAVGLHRAFGLSPTSSEDLR